MQSKPVSPGRRIRTNLHDGLEYEQHALALKGTDAKVGSSALRKGL